MTATHDPIELRDDTFEAEVLSAERPVLVDFHADWCGPCRTLAPVVEGLAHELAGRLTVGKLDVDANPETAARFGVRAIPTLLLFHRGQVIGRLVGAVQRARIETLVHDVLEEESHAVPA